MWLGSHYLCLCDLLCSLLTISLWSTSTTCHVALRTRKLRTLCGCFMLAAPGEATVSYSNGKWKAEDLEHSVKVSPEFYIGCQHLLYSDKTRHICISNKNLKNKWEKKIFFCERDLCRMFNTFGFIRSKFVSYMYWRLRVYCKCCIIHSGSLVNNLVLLLYKLIILSHTLIYWISFDLVLCA